MDYRDFMKRIGDKIGEAKAADRIEEISWLNIVVKEVKRYIERKQLQKETGSVWKKHSYILDQMKHLQLDSWPKRSH